MSGEKRRVDPARVWFITSCAVLLFGYGVAVGRYQLFPFEILNFGVASLLEVRSEARTLLGIRPDWYLSEARYEGDGVTVLDRERMAPGLTLVSGMFDGQEQLRLIRPDGTPVRSWPAGVTRFFDPATHPRPEAVPTSDWNAQVHGALALPDGSVLFNFDYIGTVKLDRCGAIEWTLPLSTHHSIEPAREGGFWIPGRRYVDRVAGFPVSGEGYEEDLILRVSETGEVLEEVSVPGLLVENGLLHLLTLEGTAPVFRSGELVHLNDIEELPDSLAAAFPGFRSGDLLLSLRDLQLVMVVDPESGRLRWHQMGPWIRQHDPDFQADGTITLFNNKLDDTRSGEHLGGSEVLEVDPATGRTRVLYGGRPDQPMYTPFLGKHQVLPNGNILITEAEAGRLLEVDRSGDIVWELVNRHDEEHLAAMAQATRYAPGYFHVSDWTCAP